MCVCDICVMVSKKFVDVDIEVTMASLLQGPRPQ